MSGKQLPKFGLSAPPNPVPASEWHWHPVHHHVRVFPGRPLSTPLAPTAAAAHPPAGKDALSAAFKKLAIN